MYIFVYTYTYCVMISKYMIFIIIQYSYWISSHNSQRFKPQTSKQQLFYFIYTSSFSFRFRYYFNFVHCFHVVFANYVPSIIHSPVLHTSGYRPSNVCAIHHHPGLAASPPRNEYYVHLLINCPIRQDLHHISFIICLYNNCKYTNKLKFIMQTKIINSLIFIIKRMFR